MRTPAAPAIATPRDQRAGHDIHLDACIEFERILVRTRNTTYEVVVLCGHTGEVLVRGGKLFRQFRRATIAGSILGGTAVNLGTICVGCHLELRVDGESFVTSPIEGVSSYRIPAPEGTA